MNDITKHLLKTFLPYLTAFLLGVIVAWRGCETGSGESVTEIIEKPVPTVQYVDRWKTDTVRFVKWRIKYDTITTERWGERIVRDTLYIVDTLKIVETWLSEVAQYDTTAQVGGSAVRLRWQNYQNRTENLQIELENKVVRAKFALGVHGNAGLLSDFNTRYTPLMGIGLQATVNRNYYRLDYGFNGDHYIGIGVGRNIISK